METKSVNRSYYQIQIHIVPIHTFGESHWESRFHRTAYFSTAWDFSMWDIWWNYTNKWQVVCLHHFVIVPLCTAIVCWTRAHTHSFSLLCSIIPLLAHSSFCSVLFYSQHNITNRYVIQYIKICSYSGEYAISIECLWWYCLRRILVGLLVLHNYDILYVLSVPVVVNAINMIRILFDVCRGVWCLCIM